MSASVRVHTEIWLRFSRLFQDKITCFSRLFKAFCSSLCEQKHYKIGFQTLKFPIRCILLFSTLNGIQIFELCFVPWTARKLTHARIINSVTDMHFPGQHYSFQGFFQTFPFRWSFSRLFKALKISTLNFRTLHTFPGSVQTLISVTSLWLDPCIIDTAVRQQHIWVWVHCTCQSKRRTVWT